MDNDQRTGAMWANMADDIGYHKMSTGFQGGDGGKRRIMIVSNKDLLSSQHRVAGSDRRRAVRFLVIHTFDKEQSALLSEQIEDRSGHVRFTADGDLMVKRQDSEESSAGFVYVNPIGRTSRFTSNTVPGVFTLQAADDHVTDTLLYETPTMVEERRSFPTSRGGGFLWTWDRHMAMNKNGTYILLKHAGRWSLLYNWFHTSQLSAYSKWLDETTTDDSKRGNVEFGALKTVGSTRGMRNVIENYSYCMRLCVGTDGIGSDKPSDRGRMFMDPACAILFNEDTCGRSFFYGSNGIADEGRDVNTFKWDRLSEMIFKRELGEKRFTTMKDRQSGAAVDAPDCMSNGSIALYVQAVHHASKGAFVTEFWNRHRPTNETNVYVDCSINTMVEGDLHQEGNEFSNACGVSFDDILIEEENREVEAQREKLRVARREAEAEAAKEAAEQERILALEEAERIRHEDEEETRLLLLARDNADLPEEELSELDVPADGGDADPFLYPPYSVSGDSIDGTAREKEDVREAGPVRSAGSAGSFDLSRWLSRGAALGGLVLLVAMVASSRGSSTDGGKGSTQSTRVNHVAPPGPSLF